MNERLLNSELSGSFEYLTSELLNEVVNAGDLAISTRDRGLHATVKSTKEDIVTEGDLVVSRQLSTQLYSLFPGITLLDEENNTSSAIDPSVAELLAVIDPIDGTGNYFSLKPDWGVSVGILKKGEIVAGIIYQPETKELYYSEQGKGAFRNGTVLHTAQPNNPDKFLLVGSPPYQSDKNEFDANTRVKRKLSEGGIQCMAIGSQVIELMRVASGESDCFLHLKTKPWDVAAGISICTEAGANITNAYGDPYSLFEETILVAAKGINTEIITKIVNEELPDSSFTA